MEVEEVEEEEVEDLAAWGGCFLRYRQIQVHQI